MLRKIGNIVLTKCVEVQITSELLNSLAFSEDLERSLPGLEKELNMDVLLEFWQIELSGISVVYSDSSLSLQTRFLLNKSYSVSLMKVSCM